VDGQTTTRAAISATRAAATEVERETQADAATAVADPWVTIVWNDPVNLMSYVSYVFESYFGYPPAKAKKLMMQVHHDGRAVVSSGPRERMEVDVQAMHGFGLWATLRQSGASDGGVDGAAGGAA
jgi:ATP-dependent Clp protease adaptor protein ClpS